MPEALLVHSSFFPCLPGRSLDQSDLARRNLFTVSPPDFCHDSVISCLFRVCVIVYVWICVSTSVYIPLYCLYLCLYASSYIFVLCLCVFLLCLHACVVYFFLRVCLCTYICVYVCFCACLHMYSMWAVVSIASRPYILTMGT